MRPAALTVRSFSQRTSMIQDDEVRAFLHTLGRLMPVGKGQIGLLSETLLYVAMQRTGQIIHQAGRRYIVGDLFHIGVQEALFLSITLIA